MALSLSLRPGFPAFRDSTRKRSQDSLPQTPTCDMVASCLAETCHGRLVLPDAHARAVPNLDDKPAQNPQILSRQSIKSDHSGVHILLRGANLAKNVVPLEP